MIPFKPRVAKTIDRSDRDSISATASVNFKTIDCTVEGDGSEVFDYELYIRHDGTANIQMVLNSLTAYSQDYMQGRSTTPSANTTASVSSIPVLRCDNATYTSMSKIKITGYIGNKRHIEVFKGGQDGATFVRVGSFYTADTSSEITSISFFSTSTQTVVFSCVGTAVPKLQYNPHAILLKHKTLTAQTADIIFGGVNDTEGVDDLDGDIYDYYMVSNLDTTSNAYMNIYLNNVKTGNKIRQALLNNSGSPLSANATNSTFDGQINQQGFAYINSEVGRKGIVESAHNTDGNAFVQQITYISNPNTSTKLTNIGLGFNIATTGNVQLYAAPKGYNADMTPWEFRQVHSVSNASFAGGHSFDIPSNAMFARIKAIGNSVSGSNIELDFDTTTVLDKQYLKSSTSSTTASFATNRTIGKIDAVSNIDCIIALKSGANRPILSKSNYNENTIDLNGLWALDSSTNYTQLTLKADNTNAMTTEFAVSFI